MKCTRRKLQWLNWLICVPSAMSFIVLSVEAQTDAILSPFLSNVHVRPDTRDVIISFTSTQKAPPLIEIGKVAPAPDPQGILAFPANGAAFSRFVPGQDGKYSLNLGTLGEQLEIGTRYYYIINVFNDDRNNTQRPRHQVTGEFTTLPQTVKVIFTDLRILPRLGDPTILVKANYVFIFDVNVDYQRLGRDCFCRSDWFYRVPGRSVLGRVREIYSNTRGTYYEPEPVTLPKGEISLQGEEIGIENSRDQVVIVVQGLQDYGYRPPGGSSKQAGYGTFAEEVTRTAGYAPYNNPRAGAAYFNVAKGNFDLSAYPLGPDDIVSIPFTLSSQPLVRGRLDGYLAFEISGRIEVTRPAPPPVKAAARVRLGSNDFNADGSGDILWHNASTGESQIWFMSGSSRIGRAGVVDGARPTLIGPPWRIVGSRDFNSDGKTDLLWHNSSTGETQIWHMSGHAFSGKATVLDENGNALLVGLPWSIVGTNDFNGDRRSDIVWHNSATGATQIWEMNGHRVTGRATVLDENGSQLLVGLPWSIVGSNDFNSDRKPDIVWHNASTRATQIWYVDGFRVIGRATVLDENGSAIMVGLPWRITGTNDFNRDGSADIIWHNGSTGALQIWSMKGSSIVGRATVDADRDGGGALVGSPWSIMNH